MTDSLDSLEALDELTDRFFDRALLPTLILDASSGRILAVNAAGVQFFGWPRIDLVGRIARDLLIDPLPVGSLSHRRSPHDPTILTRKVRTARGVRQTEIHAPVGGTDGQVFVQIVDMSDRIPEVRSPRDVPDPSGPAPHAAEPGSAVEGLATTDPAALFAESPIAALTVGLADGLVRWANDATAMALERSWDEIIGQPIDSILTALAPNLDVVATLRRFGGSMQQPMTFGGKHQVMAYATTAGAADDTVAIIQVVPMPRAAESVGSVVPPPPRSTPPPPHTAGWEVGLGSLITAISLLTLVGWITGIPELLRLGSEWSPMSRATSALLALYSVVLVDPMHRAARWVRSIPIGIVVAGATTSLVTQAAGSSGYLDRLIPVDARVADMSVNQSASAASAAILLGLGVVAGMRLWMPERGVKVAQAILLVASGLLLLSGLGFLYSMAGSEMLHRSAGMAARAAVCLSLGTLAAWLPLSRSGIFLPVVNPLAGGRFARRLLPVGFIVVITTTVATVLLRRHDVLSNGPLQLSFMTVTTLSVMFAFVLYTSRRVNDLDQSAADARQDVETVIAAFSDRHYRISGDDLARPVMGSGSSTAVPAAALVPAAVRDEIVAAVAETRTLDVGRSMSFVPDTGVGRLEVRFEPLDDDNIAMAIRDVSELAAVSDSLAQLTEQLEDQVQARTAELERTNRDLEQFAYLASHDLQEPLRMVSTFVGRLAEHLGDDLDERGETYANFAVDGAQRMTELIDGLLRYSRAGRETPTVADIDLDQVVDVVLQTLGEPVAASGAVVMVSSELPRVRADEALLRQILQNLFTNALRFVEPGRSPVLDVTATRTDAGLVAISVADNGIGVDPQFQDQIFQMFRRLHGRAAYPGTGIGLSLVQRLVEVHGGEVWLDTEYGPPGARFVFTLPAAATYRVRPNDAS